jgi:thioredoxin 1
MENLIKLENSNEFNSLISKGTVLVDFYADWCGPCRMIAPVLEELANENPNVKIIKVDVDAHQQLAGEYQVMSIPTLIVFKDGQKTAQELGALPKERLADLIK